MSFERSSVAEQGLSALAKALADGMLSADFSYSNAVVPSTCATTCGPSGVCTSGADGLLTGLAVYQQSSTDAPASLSDMSVSWFDLQLPTASLVACGFSLDASASGPSTSVYRNSLCGDFKYDECFSGNYSSVAVPTTFRTCFDMQVGHRDSSSIPIQHPFSV